MVRILLADDDVAVCDVMRRLLEADGHRVDAVHDGAEALERLTAETGAFEAVVADVNMPGLDGITLAERAAGLLPDLRILLMSGFPEALERGRAIRGARIATLTKPFTIDAARTAVRALLG